MSTREHLVALVEAVPAGSVVTVPVDWLAEVLAPGLKPVGEAPPQAPSSWRDRLWVVPPETRLGVREAAEALGRPASWLYRRTGPRSKAAPLPHRRLGGSIVFLAGELRQWVTEHEARVA